MLVRGRQRGDTIIEVLFAVAVFSMIAVAAMGIMNRGTSVAQRSLEVTLVRQQIDAQAEALRFIHHAYIVAKDTDAEDVLPAVEWKRLIGEAPGAGGTTLDLMKADTSSFGSGCDTIPTKAFVMNARTGRIHTGAIKPMSAEGSRPFSQVVYDDAIENDMTATDVSDMSPVISSVEGIWIEAVRLPDAKAEGGIGFIDFHIRACWHSPASSVPSTIGTIVRLYDPRS